MGSKNIKKIMAFTLAEVLITLGIIGIVASMTIPTLVNNVQKREYVSRLRKTYAILNQAFQKYAADQGCVGDLKCTGLFSDTTPNKATEWRDFFNNYLKVSKDCGTGAGCFPAEESYFNLAAGGVMTPDSDTDYYKVILADGQSVGVQTFDFQLNCNADANNVAAGSLRKGCAWIIIDTNGSKGPNKAGRDYFPENSLDLTSEHFVVPYFGSKDWASATYSPIQVWSDTTISAFYCGTAADSVGYACASRIIEEGWEMNY